MFISFTMKAVHLEVVSDLTCEAFMCGLRRFIARREKPQEIFSDNGTNFIGVSVSFTSYYQVILSRI